MRTLHTVGAALCIAALASVAAAAQAAGIVSVSFVQPENFTDVRDSFMSRERHLGALKSHIEQAAAPYVADGQTLKIEVLDVDLAGETRLTRRATNLRVLKGRGDWPRIKLRYALEAGGQPLRSGEARVQDMSYLDRFAGALQDTALRYERRMLDEWFRDEFGAAAKH